MILNFPVLSGSFRRTSLKQAKINLKLEYAFPIVIKMSSYPELFLRNSMPLLETFKYFIIWNTTKIRSLFPLKDKNQHPNCVIYEGVCTCGLKYIGETSRCLHLRQREHENLKGNSEPSRHLKINTTHSFEWKVIANAPKNFSKRKILEALYIGKFKPGLNEQVLSKKLKLFVYGVT